MEKTLTQSKILELITDIAYQQATRDYSGTEWFREFLEKINDMQKESK